MTDKFSVSADITISVDISVMENPMSVSVLADMNLGISVSVTIIYKLSRS